MNKSVFTVLLAAVLCGCALALTPHQSHYGSANWRPAFPLPPVGDVSPKGQQYVEATKFLNAGEPLIVNKMDPKEARERSRVKLPSHLFENPSVAASLPPQYAGFVEVDSRCNSNMFYWFFEAQNGDKNAPLLLWLQGGPGGSSLFGLFGENGPFSVSSDLKLMPRNVTWASTFNLIYIDNPVGVGFSHTNKTDLSCYSTNEDQVATNLYATMQGFYQTYPEYAKNDFYVTGESYAGKYVPALAYHIHQQNQAMDSGSLSLSPSTTRINLAGVAIGDGLTDPLTQVTGYADIALNIGLADRNEYKVMKSMQDQSVSYIKAEQWDLCFQEFTKLIDGPPDYFYNITGSNNYYDIRYSYNRAYGGPYYEFVNLPEVRAALNVGDNLFGQDGDTAGNALNDDICKSMVYAVPVLLEANYKVLFYNGQFDFIVAGPLTEIMLWNMNWSGLKGYQNAKKKIWRLPAEKKEVAGYVRQYKNLMQIIVRDAGHILPADQPERAFDMITRFVNDQPF